MRPHFKRRLGYRRKRRFHQARQLDVIEANHFDFVGHRHLFLLERAQRAHRHEIICRKKRVERQLAIASAPALFQQRQRSPIGAVQRKIAAQDMQGRFRQAAFPQRIVHACQPLPGLRQVARAVDE